jgi:hypothetical protein
MSLSNELRQPTLDQIMKNHVKVARAAIRLKHSIAADNELESVLPELRARLASQMQQGYIAGLSVAEMLALVEGTE